MKSKELFPEHRRDYIKGKLKSDTYENERLSSLLKALEICENDLQESLEFLNNCKSYIKDIEIILKLEKFLQTKK